jgi:hypothetical protein
LAGFEAWTGQERRFGLEQQDVVSGILSSLPQVRRFEA